MWSTLICWDFHGPLQILRKGGCHTCCRLWDGFHAPIVNFFLSLLDVRAGVCQVWILLDYQGRQWLADVLRELVLLGEGDGGIHDTQATKARRKCKQSPHILTRGGSAGQRWQEWLADFRLQGLKMGRQITSDTSHKHQPVDKRVRKCRKRSMWLRLSNLRQLGELPGPGDDSFFQVLWCKQCRSQWSSKQTATFRGDLHTCVSKYSLGQLEVLLFDNQPGFFCVRIHVVAWPLKTCVLRHPILL